MKNKWYKTKIFAVAILVFASVAYAAGVPEKILSDSIILGKGSSTDSKNIEFNTGDGASNVNLTVTDARLGSLNTNSLTLGDGTDVVQSLIFDQSTSDVTFGVDASQNASINSSQLTMGDGTAADQKLIFDRGANNPFIKWDEASSKLVIANDGSTEEAILSGAAGNEPSLLDNIGSSTSVGSSALTINLKQADGSTDPTAPSPDRISFRSSTAATGGYNIRSVTAALSIVIPSGATLGHADGADAFVYVYALDNAGTVELAVSSAVKDESSLQTSLTIGTGSDDDDFYSTTGRSNVPIRLLLRLKSNQVTAGTWDLNVIENSPDAPTRTDVTNSLNRLDKSLHTIVRDDQSLGELRFVSAIIDNSGTPTINTEFGSANNWISSLGDTGVGVVTVNFRTNVFDGSTNVSCSCSASSAGVNCTRTAATTTSIIRTNVGATGAAIDQQFTIHCFGVKGSLD